VKLADFGFAKKVTAKNCLQTLCGTAQYVAPEILDSNVDGYDHRADMWSVGVVTFVLLGGYAPFDGPLEQLANTIIRGDYEFHVNSWSNISLQAKDMISAMLQVNPDRRMTADGALGCSWMEMEDGSLILSDLSSVQEQLRKTLPPTDKVKTAVQAVRFLVGLGLGLGRFGVITNSVALLLPTDYYEKQTDVTCGCDHHCQTKISSAGEYK
jgi:calcium/calmodulin-dependent protein kinase I